ncbi:glycerophosphodiester phosphodiesterase [Niallia nealsonii]|uniref:Glycerophosphodiester phosphodiesterase n=1 Tax=Niallia nealsonii TaxID=115979 RepID=A0A2N0Z5A3_9BACI|nr:glycerophosphodiester phosphodiesterase [Niallia nealsonii]PKG24669.1 glycerophosphodiester phosphodiesterase [Niallia nealsonii]
MGKVRIPLFAHRGVSGRFPENTMEAFEASRRAGVSGIELDVQLTKDGTVVIIHDETVNCTTNGHGYVKDLTDQEIFKLDAGSWFHLNFSGAKIPTLEEFFSWAVQENNQLIINIELKNDVVNYKGLEEKVIALIEQYDLEDRIILSSFNWESLRKVRDLKPVIEIALLVKGINEEAIAEAKALYAKALHTEISFARSEYGKIACEEGLLLRIYTINDGRDIQSLPVEVDCIMTDFPERFTFKQSI